MKTSANYVIKVLTTGFIVLLLFAVVLFGGRFIADARLQAGLPWDATRVEISPSGLLPHALEFDPNADRRSLARGGIDDDIQVGRLGLVDYVVSKSPGGRRSDVFYFRDDGDWMYFDRANGQIVLRKTDEQAKRVVTYYAGPDGSSDLPSVEHGRFIEPMIAHGWTVYFVYDAGLHRFFSIDRRTKRVRTGPQLEDTPAVRPVRIGVPEGGAVMGTYAEMGTYVDWQPPMKLVPREKEADDTRQQYDYEFTLQFGPGDPGGYIPVVDASGRIDLLDGQTLNLIQGRGALLAPRTLYGRGRSQPNQLLDYAVELVGVGRDPEYLGMVVSSVSRQGTSMRVAVYDKSGQPIGQADTVADFHDPAGRSRQVPSAKAALFEVPWGPALTVFKYLLENVHPPILTVASFFVGNAVDAQASHRALFLLPNSFVAMHRDHVRDGMASQLVRALWTMFPAFLLAGFLTWRVVRDGALVGLSSNARAGWIIGTLAFGLAAYITYRLTRPKATLVTCANCGRPRRPDMDRCHRCNSPWSVPELVPPAWRVLDGGLHASAQTSESEKQAIQPEQKPDSSVESM